MRQRVGSVLMLGVLVGGCGPDPVTARRPVPGSIARPDAAALLSDAGAVVLLRDAGGGEAGPATQAKAPSTDAGREAPGDAGLADRGYEASVSSAESDANVATSEVDGGSDARPPRVGELVIDEILANPTGQDLGREWIEIANRGPERLDLSALHVADATTDAAVAAGTIEPGGLLVIGQSLDASKNGGAPVGAAYGTHLILNNDAETVSLCLGACATGVVLDQVGWEAIGAGYDGHALIIDPTTKVLCPAQSPFGAAGDFGTPGELNPPCDAPDAGTDSEADSLGLPHDPHG